MRQSLSDNMTDSSALNLKSHQPIDIFIKSHSSFMDFVLFCFFVTVMVIMHTKAKSLDPKRVCCMVNI